MGFLFTVPMGFLFTATLAFLFTMTLGFQLTISTLGLAHGVAGFPAAFPGRPGQTNVERLNQHAALLQPL